MKFNGAIVSKPLKDQLEKTQQKSLQRGSAEIAFTDIGNYEPSKIPEAAFEIALDNQKRIFKIVEKHFINDDVKYTLSTSTVTDNEKANIYFITVQVKSGLINAYKFTLSASGVTYDILSNIPRSIKVYFDFM